MRDRFVVDRAAHSRSFQAGGTSPAVTCDPPPQTSIPAAFGQRGAGHQQLHVGEGFELLFSDSHVVTSTHQSCACRQWEPPEGAESAGESDEGCWVTGYSLPADAEVGTAPGGSSDFGPLGSVNLGSGLI